MKSKIRRNKCRKFAASSYSITPKQRFFFSKNHSLCCCWFRVSYGNFQIKSRLPTFASISWKSFGSWNKKNTISSRFQYARPRMPRVLPDRTVEKEAEQKGSWKKWTHFDWVSSRTEINDRRVSVCLCVVSETKETRKQNNRIHRGMLFGGAGAANCRSWWSASATESATSFFILFQFTVLFLQRITRSSLRAGH